MTRSFPTDEDRAREILATDVFDYFACGAGAEVTLRDNRSAFESIRLLPNVMTPVANRDQSIELLGRRLPCPIVVAPMAFQKLAHADGESAVARACAAEGVVLVASTMATESLEDISAAGPDGTRWFQLYAFKDEGVTRSLIERAVAAGYSAVQITADVPVMGLREADIHNRFSLPPTLSVKNLESYGHGSLSADETNSGPALYTRYLFDPELSWSRLSRLIEDCPIPVMVKGVLRGDDACRAVDAGVAAVVVSNHGGRQLDTVPATIRVLPEVVAAVNGRCPVLVDGGIRRGTDVVKALALGARAVQVGRPIIWGLACGGESGVRRVLAGLRNELDNAMALCGRCRIADLTSDLIA